jgi:methylmalonyl-CoA/ethylmalonyl-CoA epimerase
MQLDHSSFKHIEHIGIAVKDGEKSKHLFSLLFNATSYKSEAVTSEHVLTHFYQIGPNKIELLEPTSEESAISKFIEKKGEGIHHIAFAVDNIEEEMKRLKNAGIQFINEIPKKGADNKLIAFLHPKSCNGVLIELCQEIVE